MKKILSLTVGLASGLFAHAQSPDLFFSEYVEGSSFNKALEIYNPTGAAVNLADYEVLRFNNGSATASGTYTPNGMLAADDVFVIAHTSATTPFTSVADDNNNITDFNGDDAVVLIHTPTGDTLDIIGVVGTDPGSSWPVATGSTKDRTLVRKSTVAEGTTDWALSSASQWDVFQSDFADSLGMHIYSATPPPAVVASAIADSNATCTGALTGGATASATGGTAPFTYAWSNGDNTASITGVADGTYTVTITDDAGMTDVATVVITADLVAQAAPQFIDFTGFTGSNLSSVPSMNWREASGFPLPTGTSSVWLNQTNLGSTGNVTAKINLYTNTREEWIISPLTTITATDELSYEVAVTNYNSTTTGDVMGSDDKMYVMISSDCGASWTAIDSVDASNNLTITLTERTVSLAAYAGQDVQIGFLATDGPVNDSEDYDLHLDNIFIRTPPSVDLAAGLLTAPVSGNGCLTATETVTIEIINTAGSTIDFSVDSATVGTVISGPNATTLTTVVNSGTLASGDTLAVTLPTYDMTAAGTYDFEVFVNTANDGFLPNDTSLITTTIVNSGVASLPSEVSFDGFTGANLTTAFADWSEGSGAAAPTGTTSAWTDRTGVSSTGNITARINLYTNTRNEWIVGPKFMVTAGNYVAYDVAVTDWNSSTASAVMGSDDMLRVMISTDCGGTWSAIDTIDASNNLTTTLATQLVDLSAYAGQEAIIAFLATDGPVDDSEDYDLHLDNIFIGTPAAVDLAANALITPVVGNGCFTATETVEVEISNNSYFDIDFSVDSATVGAVIAGPNPTTISTVINTGTLTSGSSLSVTIPTTYDMTANGIYDFDVFVTSANDADTSNDTIAASIAYDLATLPSQVSFDGFTGADLTTSFPDWREGSGTAAPSGTTSLWTDQTGLGFAGNVTAKINLYTDTRDDWIVGPRFLVGAGDLLTYDVAVTNYNSTTVGDVMGSDDMLRVMISTDCGATWSAIDTIDASHNLSINLTPQMVDLAAYVGQEVTLAFLATDGPVDDTEDYDLHLDNIFIGTPPSIDMQAHMLETPNTGCFGATETVSAYVINSTFVTMDFSTDTTTVTVDITGANPTMLTAELNSGTLAAGDTLLVTFPTTYDMSAPGTYNFEVAVNVANDGDINNDTASVVTIENIPFGTIPSQVNFDGFTGADLTASFPDWHEATGAMVPTGTTSTWLSQTGVDATGNVTARINLYGNSKNDWLVGPKFTVAANNAVSYKVAVTNWNSTTVSDVMGSDDKLYVMVSTDCQSTWTAIDSVDASNNLTTSLAIRYADLSAYVGQDVTIAFLASEGTVNDPEDYDLHIDDIFIGVPPVAIDMQAEMLTAPTTGCFGATETITAEISNNGFYDIDFSVDSVTVTVDVTGTNPTTLSTVVNTGTLSFGNTLAVTMPTTLDMSAAGTYDFEVSVSVANDVDTSNDTASVVSLTTLPLGTIPSQVNFDGFTGANLNTVFSDWSEASGVAAPSGTTSAWVDQDDLGSVGNVTAKINLYTTTRNEWLVGPKFTVGANDQLTYKIAISDYNSVTVGGTMGSDDMVRVMISTDCGGTWSALDTIDASDNIPLTLTTRTLNLGAYVGQEAILAFLATDGPVNDLEDYDVHLDDIFIGSPVPVVATATADSTVTCNGGVNGGATVAVTGGIAPLTYAWSNGETTASITGLAAGTYNVTVTDFIGESDTSMVVITEPTAIVPTIVVDSNVTCNGGANGGLTVSAMGGTAPYSYEWNNSASTVSITGMTAGIYTVTVTDATGCTATAQDTITEPTAIAIAINTTDVGCYGDATGEASLTGGVTGGTAPYTYAWSNGEVTEVITGLTEGSYTVTVTDANGCTNTEVATIDQNDSITIAFTTNNVVCEGGDNGDITVVATGGAGTFTYEWNTGATTDAIGNLTADSYTVTVTDQLGCEKVATEVVDFDNTNPVVDLGPDQAVAPNAVVTLSSGFPSANNLWSTNETTETIDVTATQDSTIWVEVTTPEGCVGTDTIVIDVLLSTRNLNNASSIEMYPNPTNDQLTVNVEGLQANEVTIQVMNYNGQLMEEQKWNNISTQHQVDLNLGNYSSGIYLINVIIDGERSTHRVTVY